MQAAVALPPPSSPVHGIDISAVQGKLDWSEVDWDIRFVYHRCGVGNDAPDACFERNIAGARLADKVVGAYHFFYPLPVIAGHESRDAITQAKAHYRASGGLGEKAGDLPPAIDFEWPTPEEWKKWGCTKEQIVLACEEYAGEMALLHGVKPLIYTYPYWWKALGSPSFGGEYPLWLASYTTSPVHLSPWNECAVWQSTGGGGRLSNGMPVDTDVVANEETFQSLLVR